MAFVLLLIVISLSMVSRHLLTSSQEFCHAKMDLRIINNSNNKEEIDLRGRQRKGTLRIDQVSLWCLDMVNIHLK